MESNAEPSESGGMVALVSFVSSGDAAEDEPTRHLFLSARRPNAGLYLQDLSSGVKKFYRRALKPRMDTNGHGFAKA